MQIKQFFYFTMKQKDNNHIYKKIRKKPPHSENNVYIIQRTNTGFQNVYIIPLK